LLSVRNQVQEGMRISSYSELRRHLAAAIDRVNADREPLIITRDRGKPMAVLMSLEDFASYEETRHLLRSAKNAERLSENSRAVGERSGRSPSEARLQRACLGGLPLLAGE
jgi:antitoxin YefM